MPDQHPLLAFSTVVTPPSPATSGLSLTVTAGEGARFVGGGPFDLIIVPAGQAASFAAGSAAGGNFEIARGTVSGDTVTFTIRGNLGTTARAIQAGDVIGVFVPPRALTDLEALAMSPSATIVLTGSGTYTPTAGTKKIVVRAVGAGGGAAGGNASNATSGGGGAGEYREWLIAAPAGSYVYACGALGGGGASATNGTAGGDTTFGTLTAKGGSPSTFPASGLATAGGAGGTGGSGGDVAVPGQPGQPGVAALSSGSGGSGPFGSGGAGVATGAAGNNATGNGAGGGGARGSVSGGGGTAGLVVVTEYS